MIFILGTSLLAGPEALQIGLFQKYMSLSISWGGQIGPVQLSQNSLHENRHNSLHTASIDVPFVAYESRLDTLSIHV